MEFDDGFTEEETKRMEEIGDKALDLGMSFDTTGEDPDEVRNWLLGKIAGSLQIIAYYLSVLVEEKKDE